MEEENVCMMCSGARADGMEADDAIDAGLGPLRDAARLKAKQVCPSENFFNAARSLSSRSLKARAACICDGNPERAS